MLSIVICGLSIAFSQNQIKYGITNIDLDGDGKNDLVVKGFVNNVSAHTMDYYTFYVMKENLEGKVIPNLVKIKNDKDFDYSFSSSRGADCELSGVRIKKESKEIKGMQLIIARREFGETYVDSQKVTFSYYKLVYDEDWSLYIFEIYKSVVSKNSYCDVNDAFKKELGL